jgi:hypothetical protein
MRSRFVDRGYYSSVTPTHFARFRATFPHKGRLLNLQLPATAGKIALFQNFTSIPSIDKTKALTSLPL